MNLKVLPNFFWFLWRLFKGRNDRLRIAPKEVQDKRLDICKHCPLINRKGLLVKLKGPRCSICGCWLEWKKVYMMEECPKKDDKLWYTEGNFPIKIEEIEENDKLQ